MLFHCGFHMKETPPGTIFFLFLFRPWSALSYLIWCHQPAVCQRMDLSFVASSICRTAVSQDKTIALALRCQSIPGNVLCPTKWCSTGELKTSAVSSNGLFMRDCAKLFYVLNRGIMINNWDIKQLKKEVPAVFNQTIFYREQWSLIKL